MVARERRCHTVPTNQTPSQPTVDPRNKPVGAIPRGRPTNPSATHRNKPTLPVSPLRTFKSTTKTVHFRGERGRERAKRDRRGMRVGKRGQMDSTIDPAFQRSPFGSRRQPTTPSSTPTTGIPSHPILKSSPSPFRFDKIATYVLISPRRHPKPAFYHRQRRPEKRTIAASRGLTRESLFRCCYRQTNIEIRSAGGMQTETTTATVEAVKTAETAASETSATEPATSLFRFGRNARPKTG